MSVAKQFTDGVVELVDAGTIDHYIKQFTPTDREFSIYWPDGKPIVCKKPHRFSQISNIPRDAAEWSKTLKENFQKYVSGGLVLDAEERAICKELELLTANDEEWLTTEEVVSAFMVMKMCVEPAFTELQAVRLIGAPTLLFGLHQQINAMMEAITVVEELKEHERLGESSTETDGLEQKPNSAQKEGGTSLTLTTDDDQS